MNELSPCRRDLLGLIADGERTVVDLAAETGRFETNVARDLWIMHRAGLVSRRPTSVHVYYRKAGSP